MSKLPLLNSPIVCFICLLLAASITACAAPSTPAPATPGTQLPTSTSSTTPTATVTLTFTPTLAATVPTSTPTPTAQPTLQPLTVDTQPYLPDSAQALRQVSADLDGDGQEEYIVLAGFGRSAERLDFEWLQLFIIKLQRPPGHEVIFDSGPLLGQRAEALQVRDINGDGQLEVLSVQYMGAAGQTMYVLTQREGAFAFLQPHGGYFDGQDSFGENGVRLQDIDGDGIEEILASHGPAASQTEVYRWDGTAYVYVKTLTEG